MAESYSYNVSEAAQQIRSGQLSPTTYYRIAAAEDYYS